MKHSLEWLEIYTEWYIANNQTIEEPKVVKTTNGKHINVKKLKLQKPKHIKFPYKTKAKKTKKKRKWSKFYEPWDFYQRCEKTQNMRAWRRSHLCLRAVLIYLEDPQWTVFSYRMKDSLFMATLHW